MGALQMTVYTLYTLYTHRIEYVRATMPDIWQIRICIFVYKISKIIHIL